ncbi:hypothetical protein NHF46_19100 [Arthrobacter alpinus]|nr:hypothetical protein [Arthrobacter alpinus]
MVFSTWWSWLIVVAVLAVVAMILFMGRRTVKDPEAVAGGMMVRATRRIAWLYVAACVVGGLSAAVTTVWETPSPCGCLWKSSGRRCRNPWRSKLHWPWFGAADSPGPTSA